MSQRQPVIGITASTEEAADPYAEAVRDAQGLARVLLMAPPLDVEGSLEGLDGLLLTGGADIDPASYGQLPDLAANVRSRPERDAVELPLVRAALGRDLPILGICRGMQILNVVLGGSLVQDLPGHRAGGDGRSASHQVFVPPGARLTAILGMGGFMKVNSRHHQGIALPQKAPGLQVSAYSLKDGIIEAIESPRHRWVIGVQWHPERKGEVPASRNLFLRFVAAAQERSHQP